MRKSAFTLIELLVVIAVIAILISIMLPAISNTRTLGKTIHCAGNLRQIAQAANQYSTDYNGYLPPSYSSWSCFWIHQLNAYLGDVPYSISTSDYSKISKAARCAGAPDMYFSFAYANIWDTTGGNLYFGGRGKNLPYRQDKILAPGNVVFVVDAQSRADSQYFTLDNVWGNGAYNIGERHQNLSANYLFHDSHVGRYRWPQVYSSGWYTAAMP